MGQQESRGGSIPKRGPEVAPQPTLEPPEAGAPDTYSPEARQGVNRGKMDKLFRRAQTSLDVRFRGRDRAHSPSSPHSIPKKDKSRSPTSSRDSTPRSSPAVQRTQSVAIPQNVDNTACLGVSASKVEGKQIGGSSFGSAEGGSDIGSSSGFSSDSPRVAAHVVQTSIEEINHPVPFGAIGKTLDKKGSPRLTHISAPTKQNGHPILPEMKRLQPREGSELAHRGRPPSATLNNLAGTGEVNVSLPEEMSCLAPIVSAEDLGLSPIEERPEDSSNHVKNGKKATQKERAFPSFIPVNNDKVIEASVISTDRDSGRSRLNSIDKSQDIQVIRRSQIILPSGKKVSENNGNSTYTVIVSATVAATDAMNRQRNGHVSDNEQIKRDEDEETTSSPSPIGRGGDEASAEESSPDQPDSHNPSAMAASSASSLFSTPTDDVFIDAGDRSPLDSPYVSAREESHQDSTEPSPGSAESPEEDTSTLHPSQHTPEDSLSDISLGPNLNSKSTSLENLPCLNIISSSPINNTVHQPVTANYTVATSRLLSKSMPESTPLRHFHHNNLSDSTHARVGSCSGNDYRKLVSESGDSSLDRNNEEGLIAKLHMAKLSLSVDSGLELGGHRQTVRGKAEFVNHHLLLEGRYPVGATTDAELSDDIFTTHHNNWLDSDSNGEVMSGHDLAARPHRLPSYSRTRKRARYTSEDSYLQTRSARTSPVDNRSRTASSRLPSRTVSLTDVVFKPESVPEKLNFRDLEKFEGHMLIQWLCSTYDEGHHLFYILSSTDMKLLAIQFCTHLLAAGVIKRIEDDSSHSDIFKPDYMYYWAHSEPILRSLDALPGKLTLEAWPPLQDLKKEDISAGDGNAIARPAELSEHQLLIMGLRREWHEEMDRVKREHDMSVLTMKGDHASRVSNYEHRMGQLQQQVEKYRLLADIESLAHDSLVHEDSTQEWSSSVSMKKPLSSVDKCTVTDKPQPGVDRGVDCMRMLLEHAAVQTEPETVTMLSSALEKPAPSPSQQSQLPAVPPPPPPPPPPPGPPIPPGIGPPPPPPPPPPPGGIPPPPPPPPPGGIPPPPPPPLGGIPPPPPPPGGIPPPPPPPGGIHPPPPPGGGPPPPSLPCPGSLPTGPKKAKIVPSLQMKPLFWKRILSSDISKPVVETSTLGNVWESMETSSFDQSEFETLFCRPAPRKKATAEKQIKVKKTKEVAKLLDGKRSQAVGILLSSLHMTAHDIETAILEIDTSVLQFDTLQSLYDQRPESAELKLIESHLKTKPDVPLDRPEQFLYDLSQVPSFADRCFCIIFQFTFNESLSSIETRLNNIRLSSQMLMANDSVGDVLGLILDLGNYMNGGTTRGQADGFGLDILSKLKDVKNKDNSGSLLQYVVSQCLRKLEPGAKSAEDTSNEESTPSFPLPDPGDISRAASVNFDEIQEEIKKLEISLKGCDGRVSRVVRESNEETMEPFKSNMMKFLEKARVDIKEQEMNLSESRIRFDHCCMYFTVQPKPGEDSVNPKDFFSLWTSFTADFRDLWKKEEQKLVKERVRAAKERVRQIKEEQKSAITTTSTAKSKRGLKAKLASKGMI